MGETQKQPFQLSFNPSLKVYFQGSRVTSDAGLILVRGSDERLGFSELIGQHLTDCRAKYTQLPLADRLRQSPTVAWRAVQMSTTPGGWRMIDVPADWFGEDLEARGGADLWLSVIAYNLGNLWRRLVLPQRIEKWSLTSLQQRLVKTGGRLVKNARYYWLCLAESHLTRWLFGSMVRRITVLPLPTE